MEKAIEGIVRAGDPSPGARIPTHPAVVGTPLPSEDDTGPSYPLASGGVREIGRPNDAVRRPGGVYRAGPGRSDWAADRFQRGPNARWAATRVRRSSA